MLVGLGVNIEDFEMGIECGLWLGELLFCVVVWLMLLEGFVVDVVCEVLEVIFGEIMVDFMIL